MVRKKRSMAKFDFISQGLDILEGTDISTKRVRK